jgi:hypothetical protein
MGPFVVFTSMKMGLVYLDENGAGIIGKRLDVIPKAVSDLLQDPGHFLREIAAPDRNKPVAFDAQREFLPGLPQLAVRSIACRGIEFFYYSYDRAGLGALTGRWRRRDKNRRKIDLRGRCRRRCFQSCNVSAKLCLYHID